MANTSEHKIILRSLYTGSCETTASLKRTITHHQIKAYLLLALLFSIVISLMFVIIPAFSMSYGTYEKAIVQCIPRVGLIVLCIFLINKIIGLYIKNDNKIPKLLRDIITQTDTQKAIKSALISENKDDISHLVHKLLKKNGNSVLKKHNNDNDKTDKSKYFKIST